MATASAIEIKRASDQEKAATELTQIRERLDRIEQLLTPQELAPAELVEGEALATAAQVSELKQLIEALAKARK
jgi:hypothetical protein